MMITAPLLSPADVGWLIDQVTGDGETVTLVTCYSRNPRRNQSQDTVMHAARAEALWRGCRVRAEGGCHRRRLPVGRRDNLVLHIEPPAGPDLAGAMVPRRPEPHGPHRSQRLHPPRR